MILKVIVTPGAGRSALTIKGQQCRVRLSAEAQSGKANEMLCELLAKHFKVHPAAVIILKGHTVPNKVVSISGVV